MKAAARLRCENVIAEHKEIADELAGMSVLSKENSALLRQMAGYRNRMVHFYPRGLPGGAVRDLP